MLKWNGSSDFEWIISESHNLYYSYLKSKGVKMVFILDIVTNVFHQFAEYLYGNNMQVCTAIESIIF